MKYKKVTAVCDVYMPFIKKGWDFQLGYGVLNGWEKFGERFYLFQYSRFEGCYTLVGALNKETVVEWFGPEALF